MKNLIAIKIPLQASEGAWPTDAYEFWEFQQNEKLKNTRHPLSEQSKISQYTLIYQVCYSWLQNYVSHVT